ncbi:MAG: XTP/dITP diphosphatase [Hadesarchaea archaeon]|nr:XTP/dITP diphosphatase [Hadesarchaea archaeon]
MNLAFVTGNQHKFEEAESLAKNYEMKIEHHDVSYVEIQADTLEEVVKPSAQQACALVGTPCFVEDAGLFIDNLGGFPGPYSAYVFKTLGNDGILKLMNEEENRQAEFRSAVGYCEPSSKPKVFKGKIKGSIIKEKRGSKGFGFDPIFSPENSEGITFGEMELSMKNTFSHRAESIEKFLKWYKRNKEPSGD